GVRVVRGAVGGGHAGVHVDQVLHPGEVSFEAALDLCLHRGLTRLGVSRGDAPRKGQRPGAPRALRPGPAMPPARCRVCGAARRPWPRGGRRGLRA
ncbi:MAG: hypothetical protein ACK559_22960, partial [bacterium]